MKLDFSNHPKNSGQKSSLDSFQHFQSLSPCYSNLASSKKHSSLSNFPYSSRSLEPNPESLKIQEAYQFLKLRNIGCTRTEAISLASKFKIKRECYLSSLSPEYKKWKKNINEDKYKFVYSSEEDLMNMTKICEDSVGSYDKNKDFKERKINLKILTRKELKRTESEREYYSVINGLIETGKNEQKMENMIKEEPFPSIKAGNCKSKSNVSINQLKNFPTRNNKFDHSGSVEEEYFELLQREKELKEKIRAHRHLMRKTEKQAKHNWSSKRQADKNKFFDNPDLETRPTRQKHKTK